MVNDSLANRSRHVYAYNVLWTKTIDEMLACGLSAHVCIGSLFDLLCLLGMGLVAGGVHMHTFWKSL